MKSEEGMPPVEGKPLFIPNSMGMRGSRFQHPHTYNIGGKPHPLHDTRFNDREAEEALQRRFESAKKAMESGKPVMYSKPMEDRIMEVRSTPLHSLFEEANKELWEREKME